MRPLLALVTTSGALAGCLGAPTGQPADVIDAAAIDAQVDAAPMLWPPAGCDVLGVAAGPVDPGAIDDLVVADGGNHAIYLLQGGVDVDPTHHVADPTASIADHYSRTASLPDLSPPMAIITLVRGDARVAVLDTPAGGAGARLTVFDGDLRQLSQTSVPGPRPAPGSSVHLQASTFGMGMYSVFTELPAQVSFIEDQGIASATPTYKPINGTSFTMPTQVLAAGGYSRGMDPPQVFVSEGRLTQRGEAPAPPLVWTPIPIRDPAAGPLTLWRDQVVADVTGDTVPEIVAYEVTTGVPNLCALNVATGDSGCRALSNVDHALASTSMAVGSLFPGETDIVVFDLLGPGTVTGVFVLPGMRLDGSSFTAGAAPPGPSQLMLARPMSFALARLDAGGQDILGVGKDGKVRCLTFGGGGGGPPADCAP